MGCEHRYVLTFYVLQVSKNFKKYIFFTNVSLSPVHLKGRGILQKESIFPVSCIDCLH